MGFASQKTYDIEVWLPGQGHVSRDFVLLGLRRIPGAAHERALRGKEGSDAQPSSTRSTAPASPSAARSSPSWKPIKQDNGSIVVPDALLPYMGGMTK